MIGRTLAHYQILEKLGEGGMGVVYKARDSQLDRDVALKVLPAEAVTDSGARGRLVREARLASKLNHPHICTIYEVGESDGQVFVAMELVEGAPLGSWVQREKPELRKILEVVTQVADALTAAHPWSPVLSGRGLPETLTGLRATPALFAFIGADATTDWLPPQLIRDVVARMDEPRIDYVRLNLEARRAG